MFRIAPIILVLALSIGCAGFQSPREELVQGLTLEQQLDAYIDDYYDQVAGMCVELHGKAQAGQSGVDCAIKGRQLHVSWPSLAYHNAHNEDASRLYKHWCAAYGSKYGEPGQVLRHFRREGVRQGLPCRKR